jgi:hypothetical protein
VVGVAWALGARDGGAGDEGGARNAAELYRQAFRALGWSLGDSTTPAGPPLLSEDEQRAINDITFPIDPDVRAKLEHVAHHRRR